MSQHQQALTVADALAQGHSVVMIDMEAAMKDQFTDTGAAAPADHDVAHEEGHEQVMELLAQLGESAVTTAEPMKERIVLVAFQVNSGSQMHAQQLLTQELSKVELLQDTDSAGVVCWWTAMDERYDRSDNDSAVFVHKGVQAKAYALLIKLKLTGRWNRQHTS